MKPLLLSHLGLGDAIVCAGMAVELARRHDGLRMACWPHNLVSVRSFFVNHPEIEVVPVDRQTAHDPHLIQVGHYSGKPALDDEGFDAWMYRTAGVESFHRWDSDPLPKAAHAVAQHGRIMIPTYAFTHDDYQRGFIIVKNIVRPYPISATFMEGQGILANFANLRDAEEIHVINSSFFHLAESLPTKGKLFLHKYARPCSRIDLVTTRKNWNIIHETPA